MNRTIKWLSIALAAQLLLALGVFLVDRNSGATPDAPLLAVQKDQVERITIEAAGGVQAVLLRRAGQWVLPGQGDLPGDASRIEQLLDRLVALTGQTSVASSSAARERFKVADGSFERRVTLAGGGGEEHTLLVGTSPALRLTHVRAQGADDIHAVELSIADLSTANSDWLDSKLLAIPAAEVTRLEVAGLVLDRQPSTLTDPVTPGAAAPGTWEAQELSGGTTLRGGAVDALLGRVADLAIAEFLGTEEKPEYGLAAPAAAITLVRQSGMRVELKLGKTPDGSRFILKSSARPEYFRVENWMATPLIEAARRAALVEEDTVEP